MDAIKVLMVDDEERMRKLVKDFLTIKGYRVLEAGDGEEAIDIFFKEKDISLVILDELLGFELGVDEYISKPFSPKILVARIEAILRRRNGVATGEILEADGIRVDKDAHEVTVDGKPVDLSNKEFELLTYFMENKGIALSREKILNNVWNYDYFGDARTIDTHVKKLRSKLGPKGDNIKTIWGMGYKLEVDA